MRQLVLMLALASLAGAAAPEPNVIFITLDGVRWQELFNGMDPELSAGKKGVLFPILTGRLARQGVLGGQGGSGRSAQTRMVSLPSYQSLMTGFAQPCQDNDCGRVGVETFPERLVRELGLKQEQVAVFSSWVKIGPAVERREGALFTDTGPTGAEPDKTPWTEARFDKYTHRLAIDYLKNRKPRFLYLSLNDSDEYGHRGDYDNYAKTLKRYDRWISELISMLDGMGEYGRGTSVLITTDHGRGNGPEEWKHHGDNRVGAEAVWFYGRNARTLEAKGGALTSFSHAEIRPTIEALFGLKPFACAACGGPISAMTD